MSTVGALKQRVALELWRVIKAAGTRGAFLAARAAYAKRLRDEGVTEREILSACNFSDENHVGWTLREYRAGGK